jgi:hypothetical protein
MTRLKNFEIGLDMNGHVGRIGCQRDIEHHKLFLERHPIVDAGYDDRQYASQRSARYHRLSLLRNRC